MSPGLFRVWYSKYSVYKESRPGLAALKIKEVTMIITEAIAFLITLILYHMIYTLSILFYKFL